ncbi:MAG: hypothetical protein LBC82_06560 [Oscillospiraceae bacterium]|jgi:flagellar biosynthesis/type III secretory pathway protein FliH|nr:hypothetical protein [Oscillospiraceae bacterium]
MNNNFVFMPGQGGNNTALRPATGIISDEAPAVRPVLRPGIKSATLSVSEQLSNSSESTPEIANEPDEQPLNEQEQLILRKEIIREYDALRQQYVSEGEKARADAREWAQRLTETTENDIRKLFAKNETDCAQMRKEAEEQGFKDGYDRGFGEGNEKGYEEGYNKALRKCKDTLQELMNMLQSIDGERERYFKEYENRFFNVIFTIANKITVDSLKQKEKAVITKMLKEAAKGFRNSEYIKITLSKLDTEQFGTAGLDALREIFRENQHVEFEVVKDAPEGTLILDNGSEITDAGVATQLMMIEKLGKGKFRDKSEGIPPAGEADTPL